jgi:hypothetical protein
MSYRFSHSESGAGSVDRCRKCSQPTIDVIRRDDATVGDGFVG